MTAVCGKRKQIHETKARICQAISGNRTSLNSCYCLLFSLSRFLLKICTAGSNNDLSCTESKHSDILFPECVKNIQTDGQNVLLMTSLPVQIYQSIIKYQNIAKQCLLALCLSSTHTHNYSLSLCLERVCNIKVGLRQKSGLVF